MPGLLETHPARLVPAEKHAEVFRLRIAGHDYQTIADKLGYAGKGCVSYALYAELDRRVGKPCEQLRQLELARLDALWTPLFERFATQSADPEGEIDLDLVNKLLKVSEQRSRLLGLTSAKFQINLGEEEQTAAPKASPAEQVQSLLDKLRSRVADRAKPLDVIDHETNGHQP